jgi:hypothetical protein
VRIAVNPDEHSSMLAQWQGAQAEIWIFDLTFRRLALLLRKPGADDILYVVGIGCRHITGPFRWDNAHLSIAPSDTRRSDVTGEPLIRLFDQGAGFELLCNSGVGLVRGLRSDIVNSFGDEFLSHHSQEH